MVPTFKISEINMSNVNSQIQNNTNGILACNNRLDSMAAQLVAISSSLQSINAAITPTPPNSEQIAGNSINRHPPPEVLACHDWNKARNLVITDNLLPDGESAPQFLYNNADKFDTIILPEGGSFKNWSNSLFNKLLNFNFNIIGEITSMDYPPVKDLYMQCLEAWKSGSRIALSTRKYKVLNFSGTPQ
jgi:hypothetical protein